MGWEVDLDEFMSKLDEVEAKEAAEDASDAGDNAGEGGKGGSKKGKTKKGAVKVETLPSAAGIRVVPRIAEELKLKAAKIVAAKERKANKDEKSKNVKSEVKDEFDEMADGKKLLQSKLDFKPKKEVTKGSKGNPWSDSDGSEDLSGSDIDDAPVAPRVRAAGTKRAVASKQANYQLDGSASSDGEILKNSSESDIQEVSDKKKVLSNKSGKSMEARKSNSDSDGFEMKKDEFDVSDSDEGGFARKVASPAKKPKIGKKVISDSSDFDDPPPPPREKAGGRSRAPVSYQGLDESDSDF